MSWAASTLKRDGSVHVACRPGELKGIAAIRTTAPASGGDCMRLPETHLDQYASLALFSDITHCLSAHLQDAGA